MGSHRNDRQELAKLNGFRAACIPKNLQKIYNPSTPELKIKTLSRSRKAVVL
jgi:hypothetical protein